MCALSDITGFTLTSTSMGSMVLISVDRNICFPLRYRSSVTPSRAEASVSLCWFCSLLSNGLILKEHLRQAQRLLRGVSGGAVDLACTFVGQCTVILVLYVRVLVVAVSQAHSMQSGTAAE